MYNNFTMNRYRQPPEASHITFKRLFELAKEDRANHNYGASNC